LDIEIETTGIFPKPELALYPINLITIKTTKQNKIYTFATSPYKKTKSEFVDMYACVPDELTMLKKFVMWFRKLKVDIISGWNVLDFDIKYIINRIKRLTENTELEGLENKLSYLNIIDFNERSMQYSIAGLSILDYMMLYRNFTFDTKPSYTLQNIAMAEIGEGKLEFEGAIYDIYKTDWDKFVDYNIQDVLLIEKLEKKLKFIQLTINMCHECFIPFDRVESSVAVITGYILGYARKNNMVLSDKQTKQKDWWKHEGYFNNNGYLENTKWEDKETTFEDFYVKGGHVEAYPGFYKNNIGFDFTSLYPWNIIQFNISPETKVIKPKTEDIKNLIRSTVNGVYYKKGKGLIPTIVEKLFNDRKKYKKLSFEYFKNGDAVNGQYYDGLQLIIKILINSFYGVLANPHFIFYDVDNARAVTRAGRQIIRFVSKKVNLYFRNEWNSKYKDLFPDAPDDLSFNKDITVILDTDSLHLNLDEIKTKCAPDMSLLEFCYIMEEKIFEPLYKTILGEFASSYNTENLMHFKREGIISKEMVLAKKKYITELLQQEEIIYKEPKMKFTGIEVVRSNIPLFCRNNIKDVIKLIFEERNKEKTTKMLKEIKKQFNAQDIDKISSVSSTKEYQKYVMPTEYYLKNGISFQNHSPIHYNASIAYNYVVKKHNLPYQEILEGSKMKYIYIDDKNSLGIKAIAYIGKYPEEFKTMFKINYDLQYDNTFLNIVQRLYDVLKWGKIQLQTSLLSRFIQ
jgi:DNA polymerase elongation subunit (family B)